MSWAEVPLHKVADLESGFGFPRERQGDPNQEFPFFRVSDMNLAGNEVLMTNHTNTVSRDTLAVLHARAFPPGTVIFPKIGAAIATEKKRILAKTATYDNNVMGAVPKDVVVPQFLYYWFLRLRLSDFASASHVPSIRKSVMEEIPFGLPSPSEQRRIVEILDQADALRKLRRDADAKAARILPALFHKMFGDPATNPMGWPVDQLGNLVTCLDSKRLPIKESDRALRAGMIPYYGANGPVGTIDVPIYDETLVLLAEDGGYWGPRENSAYKISGPSWVNNHAHVLRCNNDIDPDFLVWYFRLADLRAYVSGTTRGKVTQAAMNRISLPVPDEAVQKDFGLTVSAMDTLSAQTRTAGESVSNLFSTLLQRAFSGQLTAKWRQVHMQELLIEMQEQARLLNLPARS